MEQESAAAPRGLLERSLRRAASHRASCAREHRGEPLVLLRFSSKQQLDPAEHGRCIDLGSPYHHFFDIDPILRPVEDGLAYDQILRGEDRYLGGTEANAPRALVHLLMQLERRKEQIEIGAIPVESGLAIVRDRRAVGVGDVHPEMLDRAEHGGGVLRGDSDVYVYVRRGAGAAIPRERYGTAELMRYPERVEHVVHCDDLPSETVERFRASHQRPGGDV